MPGYVSSFLSFFLSCCIYQVSTTTRQEVLRPANGDQCTSANIPGSLHLTVEHRRRRAAYDMLGHDYGPLPQPQSECYSLSANPESKFSVHLSNRPDVAPWTKREIQALLLQDDVEIFVHQALGALKGAQSRQKASRTVLSVQVDKEAMIVGNGYQGSRTACQPLK